MLLMNSRNPKIVNVVSKIPAESTEFASHIHPSKVIDTNCKAKKLLSVIGIVELTRVLEP